MGAGPVAKAKPSGSTSWKLETQVAKQTQGLVVSAFAGLPVAEALFLALDPGIGGAWLTTLRSELDISDANDEKGERRSATAIAFTWSGLKAMGLDADTLETFSPPFREGMHQPDRQRRLGDALGAPTVIAGGPRWSGNNVRDPASPHTTTPTTVHAVLVLYAPDENALTGRLPPLVARLQQCGVRVAHQRRLSLMPDQRNIAREHFGFADGISQPVLYGDGIRFPSGATAEARKRWHGVEAGEVLMGHRNAHDETAPGPVVAASLHGATAHLSATGVAEGFRNLGLHGSYLVIRELYQDVAAFWNSMIEAAKTLGTGVTPDWVAERVVGRTQDGAIVRPAAAPPLPDGLEGNDVGFAELDVHGFGCPLGSHIRRGNPRDSLPSRDGPSADLLSAANAHRILRRGRKFGPEIKDRCQDDGETRGLFFMCLNSDVARHFEFVQQTWMLNRGFATLEEETDPLMGPKGRFTIPATPVRRCPVVETFVKFAGGEYFFLPSLPALNYLAGLQP
jgi:Dyp-type peroxidase family